MPVLSMFYGILISMYWDDHNPAHIHARYGEYESVFDLDANMLSGKMPRAQQKYIEAWILLHQDELRANWTLAQNHEQLFKIDPLK